MTRAALAVALLVGATAAKADEVEDERAARRLYERGLAAFQDKDWDGAIDAFLEAQEKAPAPALHYNIAQAYRLKGDCVKALVEYKRFLREDPESPRRRKVLVRVAEMQSCVARGNAPRAPDGEAGGDGQKDANAPPPPANGEDEEDPLMVPERRHRERHAPGRAMRIGGWISLGVGAALIGGGYVLSQRAADREGQIEALFQRGGQWSDAYANVEKDGRNAATMSAISYGLGAAGVLTGALLVYFGGRNEEAPAVAPMAGGRGVRGVNLRWEF